MEVKKSPVLIGARFKRHPNREDPDTDVLYGFFPCQVALSAGKRKIHKIFYLPGNRRNLPIVSRAEEIGIPTKPMRPTALNALCNKYCTHDKAGG